MKLLFTFYITLVIFVSFVPSVFAGLDAGEKGFIWSSNGERIILRVGGRVHWDSVYFDSDKSQVDDIENEGRRQRVYLSGKIEPGWSFKLERELSDNSSGFKNMWIRYFGFEDSRITLGNQFISYGMEATQSSNDLKFIERSLPNALTVSFGLGMNYSRYWEDVLMSIGVYRDGLREEEAKRNKGQGSFAARIVYSPVHEEGRTFHMGASVEYRRMEDSKPFRISVRPEVGSISKRFIRSSILEDIHVSFGHAFEAALAYRSLLLQTEFMARRAQSSSEKDPNFYGGYAQIVLALTGDHHKYSSRSGTFTIKPRKKFGSTEVALRLSRVDFTNDISRKGKQTNITTGFNWYVNDNLKLMADYVMMNVDRASAANDEKPKAFLTRLQIAF